jgi:hypothetical protein
LDLWFRRFQLCQHRVEDIFVVSSSDIVEKADDSNGDNNGAVERRRRKFQHQQEQQKKKQLHSFTVYHDINMNFSLILKAILEGLVEPITKSPVLFKDVTPTSIAFSIEISGGSS